MYVKVEFQALFEEFQNAWQFANEPFFRSNGNAHQNTTHVYVAKADDQAEFLAGFALYLTPASEASAVADLWQMAKAHNGRLDGYADPDPTPPPPPVTEPATPAAQSGAAWQS